MVVELPLAERGGKMPENFDWPEDVFGQAPHPEELPGEQDEEQQGEPDDTHAGF